ncbi:MULTISPECIES: TlpA family protein disulfide reductase [Sphingobacterium]|uniref:TlpA family protein disulfide reductase n=1 Tax=Sphingobacterium TaxID=28453 RepID=UPI001917D0C1|nr:MULTISPECIES: TlpA disulfide reductase family protein [Sphingobacterium]QQT25035.1 TlpA family protein disulfide reductase [Sphingobacterium spiritivorum]
MLKRILLSLICVIAIIFNSNAAPRKTVLTGKISGVKAGTLELNVQEYRVMAAQNKINAELSEDGTFRFEFEINGPARAFLILGTTPVEETFVLKKGDGRDTTVSSNTNRSQMIYFYLMPGDKQTLQVDATNIPGTLKLTGKYADNSLYLNEEDWNFNQYKDKHLKNYFGYFHYSPEQYLEYVEDRRRKRQEFLTHFAQKHKLTKQLKKASETVLYGDAILARLLYPKMRESYRKDNYTAPAGYYDFLNEVSLDQSGNDNGIAYFYFLDYLFKEEYRLADTDDDYIDFVATKLSGRPLYEYYAFALAGNFKKKLYDKFGTKSPFPDLAKRVREKYGKLEGMLEGNPAPQAVFENLTGDKITWSKWKGQYIYVDFWATWCGPCIQEIPALDSLRHDYKDKPITFVSISFDSKKDQQKWKDFVDNKKLEGIQLWADPENHKSVSQALNILQIPRFLLLDPQGNIVDANALRPSDKRIRLQLDKLLKNSENRL